MEPGETPIQAACREMREETNLDLSEDDLTFFGFYQKNVADHGEDGDVYYFIIHDVDDRDLQIYEGQGFAIIRNEQEAASIKTSPLFREVLKDYYRQKA